MPTKAAWLALENNEELEFEHRLALRLSMTVSQLRTQMPHSEFIRWGMYFARKAQAQEVASQRQE